MSPIVEPKAATAEFIPPEIGLLRIPYFSGAAPGGIGQSLAGTSMLSRFGQRQRGSKNRETELGYLLTEPEADFRRYSVKRVFEAR